MKRTTFLAALIAAGLGAGAMTLPEPADAGGSFSLYISPKSERGQEKLERGLRVFSHIQQRRAARRGQGNSAYVEQNGSGNTAGIYQRGSDHDASITQNGNDNAFGIFQFGKGTSGHVSQNGDGQSGVLFQGGW